LLKRAVRALRRLGADREYRSVVLMRLRHGRSLHQITPLTARDRYPELFAICRTALDTVPSPRVLSFGCSTGEELETLLDYVPGAILTGVEINPASRAVARSRPLPESAAVLGDAPRRIAARGPYDAIFCMAVLQRYPQRVLETGTTDISSLYPFAKFERQLALFDRWLAPRGLLVIQHTQYRVEDSAIAGSYERLPEDAALGQKEIRFDPTGRLIGPVDAGRIFRKA
jgi:hypothetical protein